MILDGNKGLVVSLRRIRMGGAFSHEKAQARNPTLRG